MPVMHTTAYFWLCPCPAPPPPPHEALVGGALANLKNYTIYVTSMLYIILQGLDPMMQHWYLP